MNDFSLFLFLNRLMRIINKVTFCRNHFSKYHSVKQYLTVRQNGKLVENISVNRDLQSNL